MSTAKKIAHLGIPGSFSHIAAKRMKPGFECVGLPSFREVLSALSNGTVTAAVIPIENTLAGSIYENYDLLDEFGMYICAEGNLCIEHHLLVSNPDIKIGDIKKVYSHPKALEQCKKILQSNPNIKTIAVSDTAEAARLVSESRDPSIAAIASREAADIYGLRILLGNIEDNLQNFTRFILIEKDLRKISKNTNKYSVAVLLPHRQGSLLHFLSVLDHNNCNMTKIESRPQPNQPFEYIFYIDFTFGEVQDPSAIIREMKKQSINTKVLGIYNASTL